MMSEINGSMNTDIETGISYGVIPIHDVHPVWNDDSTPFYALECPSCGNFCRDPNIEATCPYCNVEYPDYILDFVDPSSFFYDAGGYLCEQQADDVDIFIIKSPFYTTCQVCSPCAPGAGYIKDTISIGEGGIRAYCFGHDWFQDGSAPYPVYSVETGKLVNP